MDALTSLLRPYSVEEFLQQNWANKAVYIPNEGEKQFTQLFSWEKLSYLLNFHEFKYPELRLVLDEKVLDESANANLIKLCQEGATLIINGVHKLIPEIAKFTAELKSNLGYGTQINAYCSWPGRQGFSSHYDTHEVFILQVDGSKNGVYLQIPINTHCLKKNPSLYHLPIKNRILPALCLLVMFCTFHEDIGIMPLR